MAATLGAAPIVRRSGAAERRSCATLAVPVAVPLTMAGVFADAARPDDGLARRLGRQWGLRQVLLLGLIV